MDVRLVCLGAYQGDIHQADERSVRRNAGICQADVAATGLQSFANHAATAAPESGYMIRNGIAETLGRILVPAGGPDVASFVPAGGPDVASFDVQDLARAVRRYLQPASIVALARYWSRLGVGSYAALDADRDRTASTSYPSTQASTSTPAADQTRRLAAAPRRDRSRRSCHAARKSS
jgi:hypothetical protein